MRGGANILDVNMDEGMLDSAAAMTRFLNLIASEPEIARVPVMIDSSNWSVIEAGLHCVQGKADRQLDQPEGRRGGVPRQGPDRPPLRRGRRRDGLRRAAARPRRVERKVEICERAYRLLIEQAGFEPSDVIFDPNVLAIATGIEEHNDFAKNFIEATRILKQRCPGATRERRHQQPLVLLPRQRRWCARRCTRRSSTTRSAPASTWAS